jgi:hypothetical protein
MSATAGRVPVVTADLVGLRIRRLAVEANIAATYLPPERWKRRERPPVSEVERKRRAAAYALARYRKRREQINAARRVPDELKRKGVTAAEKRERKRRWDHDKGRARTLVREAVADGRLIRPSRCSRCGHFGGIHGHHEDYSKPLDVVWLCSQCHHDRHIELRDGKRPPSRRELQKRRQRKLRWRSRRS